MKLSYPFKGILLGKAHLDNVLNDAFGSYGQESRQ